MNEFICKQDLLTVFKKDEIYKRTADFDDNYPNIVQINYINFNLDKEKSTKIDPELADYIITWLEAEWETQIATKGSYINGTSGYVTPYIYDYFHKTKELRKRKLDNLCLE